MSVITCCLLFRFNLRVHAIDEARNHDANEAKVLEVERHSNTCPAPSVRILRGHTIYDGGDQNGEKWDDKGEEPILGLVLGISLCSFRPVRNVYRPH